MKLQYNLITQKMFTRIMLQILKKEKMCLKEVSLIYSELLLFNKD
jgi:hypothetical protein